MVLWLCTTLDQKPGILVLNENWNSREPIYRQLRDRVAERIIDGALAEGEAAPSVRAVASALRIHPTTVSRAYQFPVDEKLLEARRGLGMYVAAGARQRLRELERKRFLEREWPMIVKRIDRLGLKLDDLPGKPDRGSE